MTSADMTLSLSLSLSLASSLRLVSPSHVVAPFFPRIVFFLLARFRYLLRYARYATSRVERCGVTWRRLSSMDEINGDRASSCRSKLFRRERRRESDAFVKGR